MTLPPIREWWPELSPEGRLDALEHAPHLGATAREEIRVLTGAVVGMAETLTDDDLAYARESTDSASD